MVVDAMIYMYCVGFGTADGVATVVFFYWKLYQRLNNKTNKKRKGVAF